MKKPQESIDWLRALADNVPVTSDPSDVRDWKNSMALLAYIKDLEWYERQYQSLERQHKERMAKEAERRQMEALKGPHLSR